MVEGRPPSAPREPLRFWLYAGHLLTLFGLALSNACLGLAVLASPLLREGGSPAFRRGRALLAVAAAYVVLLGAAIALSREPRTSFSALRELFGLAGLPLALAALPGERRVRQLVDALVGVAVLLATFGLAQFLFGYGAIDRRIRGPFSHVMTFSGVLLLIDLLLIARLITGPSRSDSTSPASWLDRPWFAWGALVVINAALLHTLTRSAWLGLVSAVVWLTWVRRRRWLLALPAAAVLFVLVVPVPVLARVMSIANLSDESTYDRLCMIDAGARMLAEHPFSGVGPEMAERLYPIYRHPTASRLNVPHLHNSYLQLGAERGMLALAALLALLALPVRAAWRAYSSELAGSETGGGRSDLHLGVIAALFAFAIAGLFENNWGDTEVQRMALFLIAAPYCLRPISDRADAGKGA